jgi:hypothetical protein
MLKKTLLFLFINFYLFANGQYKGSTIHVFKPGEESAPPTRQHLDSLRHKDKNCLKWNWSVLTRGEFLINYEVYLGGNFTAEIGLGVTYEDFLFQATYNSASGDFMTNSAYGSASPGIGAEGGLRYYPGGYDNMEGIFLEATLSYRPYSFPNASFPNTTGSITPGYDFLDGQFKFGYVSSHWFNDFVSEFYVGIGIRNATIRSYESDEVQSNPSSVTEYYAPQTTHVAYPQPLFGFKIGYPF